jgi:CHAT domain-containing protein
VWSDKPIAKAEALRQAQLWMLENWKPRGGGDQIDDPEARRKAEERLDRLKKVGQPVPPFYWAAFVLSGDWR